MKTTTLDIENVRNNATFRYVLQLQDSLGNFYDFTGKDADMEVKNADGTTVLELTTNNGRIDFDSDTKEITLLVPEIVMANIAVGSYKYDLRFSSAEATPFVEVPVAGKFKVIAGVTT